MAREKMTMPQLGESVTEGTISRWLVKPGDHVKKYDPIAEVLTDKVNAEVPSSFTGTVVELAADEGETLEVGKVICVIETGEEGSTQKETTEQEVPAAGMTMKQKAVVSEAKTRFSPAVLKLSQEYGIDLSKVQGTGKGGRITRKDVWKWIESHHHSKTSGELPATVHSDAVEERPLNDPEKNDMKKHLHLSGAHGDLEIPVTGVRKAIAQHMVRSKQEIPHAWTMMEVDVTNLVQYRDSIKDEFKEREGFNLTYFAFFVKATAQALKEYPQMNSIWAGDKIIQKKDINISIAVATDDALYVPVIKHADEKTIKGIAREIHELAVKARNGSLKQEDVEGGTFTVNNTGSFGSVQSMGIINYPQAAILQVESIVKRLMVMDNGMIAVRDMVNLCLSIDHRILDGLIAGRFLQRVKQILENISKENTQIH
ncbi:dihydrolipoamide acetyltransferase family protein [Bacillus smithii]|uniref:dihydrolipoamide acetyltransferase family protein n=1 Tax=Bacillus smithii TaxID=1479 RepID=UPI003D1A4E40